VFSRAYFSALEARRGPRCISCSLPERDFMDALSERIWSRSDLNHIGAVPFGVFSIQMGRLSKVVVLALLLIFAGVQDLTPHLCAQPLACHAHPCCAAHQQASGMGCGTDSTVSGNPSCCKVSPVESVPALPILNPGNSQQGAYILRATSDVSGLLSAPILLPDRGFPRSVKLQNSPVHALLCTFLV
jgi:hypothetical protein